MKRFAAATLIVAFVYAAGFALLRWQFHSTNVVFLPTAAGYGPPVKQDRTFIWIPGTGAERAFKQALFWIFYPAGQMDHLITGRVYDRTEARKIIL